MKPILLLFCFACASIPFAQTPAVPTSSYPEVHADRRVTFRIAAPKATEVSLICDWQAGAQKLEKGADGVWSLTVGPLAPSSYIYSFNVDGTAMADPINPRIKLRARTSGSFFEVPAGNSPSVEEVRDVPHGAVEMNWHKATAIEGETRSVWVYTPPGYTQQTAQRYPVLYLFHGSNDRPNGWIDVGNVHLIADNLIAEKKIVPMVIVMPFGHVLPFGQRGSGARNNTTVFEDYLLKDVIPLVEGKYRVIANRENRAVSGFSMGAEQSLHVFFHHLDLFSSIGALAPSGYRVLEEKHAALLADAAGTNAKIGVLWIACGRQDPQHFPGSQQLSEALAARQIRHTWRPVEGAHNHAFVRGQLLEFLPRLFRAEK
ncbi:MAG: alpha/beta hydrolase-fold protein [Opitutaceae bacterium]